MFSLAQFLVQREADLFAENESRETPCDCAEKQHHKELALCLESQMVFSLAPEAEGIEAEYAALDRREVQYNIPRSRGYTTCSVCHPQLVLLRTKSCIISTIVLKNQFRPLTFLVSVVFIKSSSDTISTIITINAFSVSCVVNPNALR